MLNDEAFEQWCLRLELSKQTKSLIEHIRASPPARRVQSAAGNVSGRYPSKKMGVSIQHVTEVIVSVVNQVSNGKIAAFAHELGLSKNRHHAESCVPVELS